MRIAIVCFFVMVFAEIWCIIQVSHHIGAWATLILLVAGFIFGLQLMRSQGISSFMQSAQNMQAGESPLAAISESIIKALAGILLIIPGFISDIIALIILLPFVRKGFARYLTKKGRLQGFAAGGFGNAGFSGVFGDRNRGAGAFEQSGGNVYDHKGSTKPTTPESAPNRILEHEPDPKE